MRRLIARMRRLIGKFGARWTLGLILTLLAGAQAVGDLPLLTAFVERIDLLIYDKRMKAMPLVRDPRIVIVDIDEKSIAEIGRWPWGRDVIADLVVKLSDHYEVKAIGFDVVFSEQDTSSGFNTLEALSRGDLKNVRGFGEQVRALRPALDYDGRLAKALKGRPVVLGYYFDDATSPRGLLPAPAFTTAELNGRTVDARSFAGYGANLARLQSAALAGGFFNQVPDPDGVVRKVPLLVQSGKEYHQSLALATARVALGASAIRPVFVDSIALMSEKDLKQWGTLEAIAINTAPAETRIPVQKEFFSLIEFRGEGGKAGGSFKYVSAADVLKGRLERQDLAQKIVLVGTTAAGLHDNRATPVNELYPGVEVHANIISSILDGKFRVQPEYQDHMNLLQVTLIGLLLMFMLPVLSPTASIVFALAVTAAVGGFNLFMYQSERLVLPVATALLMILGIFMVNVAWGYLFEFRKGRALTNLFGEYVAPELVAEMANDPERYNMEGESRDLTVLFVDVRGFTTISEGLSPKALREYINIYLTAMSDDIRGNRGTLDKYIGDAVMAFWGAPVALPDHAARAVASALKMQVSAHRLNQEFVERGWPPLKIGIGLNTGQMHVGDMGSKVRKAYTVMGDAVNLGSRLEGITKVYGAGVVVGELTMLAAPEYAFRELDRVRVKGKLEPVPIFEPMALNAGLDQDTRASIVQWHAALALVRSQEWDQAEQILLELHRVKPDEGLYDLYLERLAYYRLHPPGADWDGVTTFETK